MDTECNDSDHDRCIAMELNPSYVALAGVHTCDSNINTANVHLQTNPSYVALSMMVSQGQDSVLRGSLPASISATVCNLGQHRDLLLQG